MYILGYMSPKHATSRRYTLYVAGVDGANKVTILENFIVGRSATKKRVHEFAP